MNRNFFYRNKFENLNHSISRSAVRAHRPYKLGLRKDINLVLVYYVGPA